MQAATLQPPVLPPFDASSASVKADPTSAPSFFDEMVYDVPLNFHFSQQMKSISEIIANVVPNEHIDNPKAALKVVNEAFLLAFVGLVNSLATNPTEPAEPYLEVLKQYLMVFHQLLNAYRPHQARQTAIALLAAQCERRKKFLEKLNERLEKSKQIVDVARSNLASIDTNPPELKPDFRPAPRHPFGLDNRDADKMDTS
jgi:mediator of RNA polymerase II transcription subunit 7